MEKQTHVTLDLTHREAVDLAKILRHYLESLPEGEAQETAQKIYAQVEPKTRFQPW
jgi:hypothetical protein